MLISTESINHAAGATLTRLRQARGWTLPELADRLQTYERAVALMEAGHGMSLAQAVRAASLFAVPLASFVSAANTDENRETGP